MEHWTANITGSVLLLTVVYTPRGIPIFADKRAAKQKLACPVFRLVFIFTHHGFCHPP
jgi:hypothetical protein